MCTSAHLNGEGSKISGRVARVHQIVGGGRRPPEPQYYSVEMIFIVTF